jgi:VCBS repeat-containing protein
MPRNWLRNLSDRLSPKNTRRQVRRTRQPGGATVQPLESRILLAAPRVVPGQSTTFTVGENIGVNGTVTNPFTPGATSNPYVDPVTGVVQANTSNGHWIGSFNVEDTDAGQFVVQAFVPNQNANSPATVTLIGQTVHVFVNNFEHFDFEGNQSFTFTTRLVDNNAPTAETADITVTINLTQRNDIPYITQIGNPNGGRDFQTFTIDENSPTGTVTNGANPGINDGGILHARTAVQHDFTSTTQNVNNSFDPHNPLDGNRGDLSGEADTVPGFPVDNTEFDSLRYQILRASSNTTTQGVLGLTNEVQRVIKDFALSQGQFLLSFDSPRTVSTIQEGNAAPAMNEIQQLDFGNVTTGAFYTLTFITNSNPSASFTTRPIFYNATAAQVQAELELLPGIGVGNVLVTPMVNVVETTKGGVGQSEVQTLNLTSTPQGATGSFFLTFNGQTTGPIAAGATAATVQTALNALPTIGGIGGAVSVTGGAGGPYSVTFGGALANVDVNAIGSTGGYTIEFRGSLSGANQNQLVMTSYTTPLNYTSSALAVQNALQALPTIGAGNVAVALTSNAFGNTGWQLTFQNQLGQQDVSQVGVLNLSDLIEISNDRPTLGRISVAPTASPFLIGNRLDGANGLNSGFEFLRDYFGLAPGAGNTQANFLAAIRVFDRTVAHPLTNTNQDAGASLTYTEYVRIGVRDVSESAPVVQDEVYRINEFTPNSGTTNGLIVGKLNDFANVSVSTITPPTMGGNEVQRVVATTTGATNPGSFALTFKGQTTSRIFYTDNALTVQNKLAALSTIGAGNVSVAGGVPAGITNTWDITFQGALAATDVPQLQVFNGVSDAEAPSQVFRYQIVGGNSGGAFAINNTTGEITVANASVLDFESSPSFRLLVQVTDVPASLPLSTIVAVDINLNDINEQTTVVPNQNFTVREGAPNGTVIGSVSFTDGDLPQFRSLLFEITNGNLTDSNNVPTFAIDPGTGQITVQSNQLLDFETQPFFDLGIRITDRGDQNTSGTGTIRISVTDVNESVPVLNDQTFTLDENTPVGSIVRSFTGISFEPTQIVTYQLLTAGVPFSVTNTNPTQTTNQGRITLTGPLDFELGPRRYDLLIIARDSLTPSLFDTAVFTIFVNDVNEQITIGPQSRTIAENSPVGTNVGAPVVVNDPDDADGVIQGKIFEIVAGNTNNAFAINASSGQITVNNTAALNFETQSGPFMLAVKVTDTGQPATSDINFVTITVTNVNDAPVVNDQFFSVLEHRVKDTLVGTVLASDEDAGQTLTYAIIGGNVGNAFRIDAVTGQIFIENPGVVDFFQNPSFNLVVQVTDNGTPVLSDTANITITVTQSTLPPPPIINDQSFNVNENAPNGTVVANLGLTGGTAPFNYFITAGNTGNAFVIDNGTGNLIVANSSQVNFGINQSFTLQVLVLDSSNPQLADQATITVNVLDVNDPPVISNQVFSVAENRPVGHVVGQVVASDPDIGQTLTFAITGGDPMGMFAIDANTGVITTATSTLDFETMPLFNLTVQVTDNGVPALSSSATVTINVLDLNEQPVILGPTVFNVAENRPVGHVVGQLNAFDPDLGQTLTWSLTGGDPTGIFNLSSTGLLTIARATLNYEATPVINLQVRVTDDGTPVQFRDGIVTINVIDLNEQPIILGPTVFNVAENRPVGHVVGQLNAFDQDIGQTLSWSLLGGDPTGIFNLSSTGLLTIAKATLNYEATPVINLQVRVTDNGTPVQFRNGTVRINVIDLNEQPVILAPTTFSLAENSPNGTVVGTLNAFDQDIGQTLTWSITGGNTGNAFAINAATGQLRVNNSLMLDFETTPVFQLQVRVTDNGTPVQFRNGVITINLIDLNENPPVINPQTFSIPENSPVNTLVGTVVATDPDPGQTVSFAIVGGNTNNAFTINAATGQLRVNNPAALDFETIKSFSLIVRATDSGTPQLSAQATVTVNLIDVNEPPVINNQTFTVPENTVNGNAVATITASNPDIGQSLTYAIIGGNTLGAFSIDANSGVVRVANSAALNFEERQSIVLTVRVTDNGTPPLSAQAQITFQILDRNDAPKIANQTFTVGRASANGTLVGTVVATDEDVGQTLTYAITGGNTGGAFAISSVNGQLFVSNRNALFGRSSIPLNVTVTDNGAGNLKATATITVNIVAGSLSVAGSTSTSGSSTTTATSSGTLASQTVVTSAATTTTTVKKDEPAVTTTASSTDTGTNGLLTKALAPKTTK